MKDVSHLVALTQWGLFLASLWPASSYVDCMDGNLKLEGRSHTNELWIAHDWVSNDEASRAGIETTTRIQ
jgi:hypothetical protein